MEYCGVTISLNRYKVYEEVPIRKLEQGDGYHSVPPRSSRKELKEALTTLASLDIYVEGHQVVDMAFAYELRTILEEFSAKRLQGYKPGQAINAVFNAFDDGDALIERVDSLLCIKHIDGEGKERLLLSLDVVKAKTLFVILNKAILLCDFH